MGHYSRTPITVKEHKEIARVLDVEELTTILYHTLSGSHDGPEGFARFTLPKKDFSQVPKAKDQNWEYCQAVATYYVKGVGGRKSTIPSRSKRKLETVVKRLDNNNEQYTEKAISMSPKELKRAFKKESGKEAWRLYWGALRGDAITRATLYDFLGLAEEKESLTSARLILEAVKTREQQSKQEERGKQKIRKTLLDTYHTLAIQLAETTARLYETGLEQTGVLIEKDARISSLEQELEQTKIALTKAEVDLEEFLLEDPEDFEEEQESEEPLTPTDILAQHYDTLQKNYRNARAVHTLIRVLLEKKAINGKYVSLSEIRNKAKQSYGNSEKNANWDAIFIELRQQKVIQGRGAGSLFKQDITLNTKLSSDANGIRDYLQQIIAVNTQEQESTLARVS